MDEFHEFKKIARLNREIIVTEKIDGTNGLVHVAEDGTVRAGSRTRWITPEDDNFAFAAWVHANAESLRGLGPGYHYGEWWGMGIQRKYGLSERRFSLFNVSRWADDAARPSCCHVVPVLGRGVGFGCVAVAVDFLRANGSAAAPGFMQPEGVVAFHVAGNHLYKVTLEKDEERKGGRR